MIVNNDVPMRRTAIDRQITACKGAPLPDDDLLDGHLRSLLDEAASAISGIEFGEATNGQPAQITAERPGYSSTFDPAYVSATGEPRAFRTSALLHEILHASCDRAYVKPDIQELDFCNFHVVVPAPVTDQAIIAELKGQRETVTANIGKAGKALEADRGRLISDTTRAHLNARFTYALALPNVHYDTVLFELLVYLALQNAQASPTFQFLKKLSVEAADRRGDDSGRIQAI
ncbi:hypothetical protein EDD29_5817 [Actinocorallia herbida]|uniref:Uncharacterized protein n=1 Tax=Actinocorallia herbida TaxID=58109 RepID=A0A3N1D3P4_9ACTN|nr:hypothetical protein [Actinocorallia herbida]ROO88157.1 hypothetical protein EDD29_5817 [Actinocorallia herbida]